MQFQSGLNIFLCTLNSQNYVAEVLETVVGNRGIPSCLIVSDGGSTDQTAAIAKKYTENVVISQPGFIHQFNSAKSLFIYDKTLWIEGDHRFPSNFIPDIINEFKNSDFDALQGSLKCINKNNYWEKGYAYFYEIHQRIKGPKNIVSGPLLWKTTILFDVMQEQNQEAGFASDTQSAEIFKKKGYKGGLANTFAYQVQSLNKTSLKSKMNKYGNGDFIFYSTNSPNWSLRRKMKSILHPFVQYSIGYAFLSFREFKWKYIPFFVYLTYWRYLGWIKSALK